MVEYVYSIKRKASRKINWPSNEEINNLLKKHSYLEVGRILGVSDNAIRKRLKNNANIA